MGLSKEDKKSFFDIIKDDIFNVMINENIIPSVIAAIGADISNYGLSSDFIYSKNMFMIPYEDHSKWCYSKDTYSIYENYDEFIKIEDMSAIPYRAYENTIESIKDFLLYINECRRSLNGPYRYANVLGVTDYKKALEILVDSDFVTKYLNDGDENGWYNRIISIIENNGLYDWDNEMEVLKMSKKKNRIKDEIIEDNDGVALHEVEEENEDPVIENMYRVRLDWDKPDTQIFASPIYEDAKKEALKHEGYKIYINDDGELFEDPWDIEPDPEPIVIPGVKSVTIPIKGRPITLNNTLIYRNATDKASFKSLSGRFYFYDSLVVNGRARITAHEDIANRNKYPTSNPDMILGYIKL